MRAGLALLITACASHHAASTIDAAVDAPAVSVDAPIDGPPPTNVLLSGFNLPPMQGTSNAGAFMPGIYMWGYTNDQIAAANATFAVMRVPINVETANDPPSLAHLKGYIDQLADQRAIICLFGTTKAGTGTHGTGIVDDVPAAIGAWTKIHAVFGAYPNVHYEMFNEPFGYDKANPAAYVSAMTQIISGAVLPPEKCILDGMGYADDIQLVANAGWTGDLAYHFYPNWSSTHDQSAYSNLVQGKIGSLGSRTWITEFGANLSFSNVCYETYEDANQPSSADVNALRGLDDAVRALRTAGHRLKAVIVWHGWNNGDSYDYWKPENQQGACKVRLLQSHA